jgi:hypothetical protein
MHITRLCYAQLYLHTWTPAHARAHTSAHAYPRARIGGPAAHNGPRRIEHPPSASRLRWRAARGRKGGAYRVQRGDTGGVPCADVRVERRSRLERLRAEPPAVHAGGRRAHVSARMLWRPIAHAHTRALTDAARGRVSAAGPHRRPVHQCSQPRMDIDTCMHHVHI